MVNSSPNSTYGMPVVEAMRRLTKGVLDVHLMVHRPQPVLLSQFRDAARTPHHSYRGDRPSTNCVGGQSATGHLPRIGCESRDAVGRRERLPGFVRFSVGDERSGWIRRTEV